MQAALQIKKEVSDFLIRWDELINDSLAKTLNEEKLEKIISEIKLEEGEVTTSGKPIPEVKDGFKLPDNGTSPESVESVSLDSLENFEDIDLSQIIND